LVKRKWIADGDFFVVRIFGGSGAAVEKGEVGPEGGAQVCGGLGMIEEGGVGAPEVAEGEVAGVTDSHGERRGRARSVGDEG
jgi:hypothetical protein